MHSLPGGTNTHRMNVFIPKIHILSNLLSNLTPLHLFLLILQIPIALCHKQFRFLSNTNPFFSTPHYTAVVLTNVATHHPHPQARPTRPCDAIEEDHYHHANVVLIASLVYAVALNRMSLSLVYDDVEKMGLPSQLAGTECFHHFLTPLPLMMVQVSDVALEYPSAAGAVVFCISFFEGPFQVLCALHGLT